MIQLSVLVCAAGALNLKSFGRRQGTKDLLQDAALLHNAPHAAPIESLMPIYPSIEGSAAKIYWFTYSNKMDVGSVACSKLIPHL
jgi:hypothetical protein